MHVTPSAHKPRRWLLASLSLLALTLLAVPVQAQSQSAKPKERAEIITDDGVLLIGDWYPSAKGKSGPVVVLLHAIGPGQDGAKRQDWEKFPEKLQEAGYHVLTFDFRGYGDSTRLDDKFKYWNSPDRPRPARPYGNNPPGAIDKKDWRSAQHLLWLGNDLIAVKKWLNLKNNAMECNSNNICLVCAGQAGVLAQLFLYNEYTDPNRDKANDWSKPIAFQLRNPSKWEGEDISHLVLLSMPNRLGSNTLQLQLKERMWNLTQKRAVDTLTIYGGDDQPIRAFWSEAIKWIKPEKEFEELKKTGRLEVPKTKLSGTSLLNHEALGVDKAVVDYLDTHMSKGRPWIKQKEDERPMLFRIDMAVKRPADQLP